MATDTATTIKKAVSLLLPELLTNGGEILIKIGNQPITHFQHGEADKVAPALTLPEDKVAPALTLPEDKVRTADEFQQEVLNFAIDNTRSKRYTEGEQANV